MHLIKFIHQKSYERIVYKVRHDLVTLIPPFVSFLLLLIMPIGLYWLLSQVFPTLLEGQASYPLIILGFSFYYLSVILFFYTFFITFYLDLLVITNDRLLHIQQQGLFSRTISEVDLYKIQDVTSEINGVFPSFFKYGDLLIQTAGAMEKFMIQNVPNPEGLRQAILDLAEKDRRFHASNVTLNT